MAKEIHGSEVEMVVWKTATRSRVVAFGEHQDALSDKGIAIAFGKKRTAQVKSPDGCAISFGGGDAKALTAVAMLGSEGRAIGDRTAVALNHLGIAIGGEIAFADNLESQAHSENLAVNVGPRGLADGLVSISLGRDGIVVARAGGSIALAHYVQHPGRWESPHGCDPCWIDGDWYLSELRVAKVGEHGIRPDFVYRLDQEGAFVEVGPAQSLKVTATDT